MKVFEHQYQEYPLKQIYFYLTQECNLRCCHCWLNPKYLTDRSFSSLDIGLFRSAVKQAKPLGLCTVKLTGGEPLLHPHIYEILKVIRSEKLNLIIETNGVCCSPELAEEIAECENPFVAVSLNGVDAETHQWISRVEGSFEATLEGIINLRRAGLRPQIIMAVMKRNRGQIGPLTCLAESLGANSVKFNPIQPIGRGEILYEAMETLTICELVDLGEWVEQVFSTSTNLTLYYHHPLAFKPLKNLFGNRRNGNACGVLGILGVLWDGSYALCGMGATVPDLVFGHIAKDRLLDVWKETSILNKLRAGLPERLEGVCGDCLMKRLCLGCCIAQNYYRSHSLWAPYWYCEEAKRNGLFPKSRMCSREG